MRKRLKLCLLLLTATSLALLAACTKPYHAEDPSYDKLISDGKKFLMLNEGVEAQRAFAMARDDRPDSPDANFGLLLAYPMKFLNLVDDIAGIAGAFMYAAPSEDEAGGLHSLRQELDLPIGDYLQDYFGGSVEADYLQADEIFLQMAAGPDFDFELESYPVVFGASLLLQLGGEFDKTDVCAFGAVNSLIMAFLDILQAYDLNFDVSSFSIPTLDFMGDPVGAIKAIVDLLEGMLCDPDYPDFLLVKPPAGFARLNLAGINLGNIFYRFAQAFEQLAQETDDQTNDQLRYVDANGNGEFDPQTDPVEIGDLLTLDPGLAPIVQEMLIDLSYAFWEGSPLDPHPDKVDTINLAMFNDLLIYLDLLEKPVLPEGIGIDVGTFFSHPTSDGLRSMVIAIIEFLKSVYDFD